MPSMPPKEIRIADKKLADAAEHVSLISSLTPVNMHEERKKFFANQIENPQFRYKVPVDEILRAKEQVVRIEIPRTPVLGEMLNDRKNELIGRFELILSVGKDAERFSELSRKMFGVPSQKVIAHAKELLQAYGAQKRKKIIEQRLSSSMVANIFEEALEHYGLSNWRVRLRERQIAGVIVSKDERRISVADGTSLSMSRLAPLITHEIETHVLSSENGAQQPLRLLQMGMRNYLRTQEGLAAHNVATQFPDNLRPLRFWARNTLAVDYIQSHSFREVFDRVIKLGFDRRYAYGVTTKVKRGIADTKQPGGLTKDHLYLSGMQDIKDFISEGGDVRDIYIGKVAVEDIAALKKMPWLQKPRYLPDFLK